MAAKPRTRRLAKRSAPAAEEAAPESVPDTVAAASPDVDAPPAKRHVFKILDMPHEDYWKDKREMPFAVFPHTFSLSPCDNCVATCCTVDVYLTAVEALRLSITLAIPLDEIIELQADDGELGVFQSVPIPIHEGRVRLTLKHATATGACVFLHAVGERRRCSVYGLRPGACRQYPYRMQVDDMLLSAGAPTLCPTSWLQNEEVTQRLEKEIRAWYASMDEERALIAAWEAHDGEDRSFRAFTRFAIRHVAPSLGKDPEELLLPQRRQHLGDPVVVED